MIIRPDAFDRQLREALPTPTAGNLDLEEALQKLSAMIERDRPANRMIERRRGRLVRFRPTGACAGM